MRREGQRTAHQLAGLQRDDLRGPGELSGPDQHVVGGAEPLHAMKAHDRREADEPVR